MTVADVTALITQVGFPIAVCLICFWYINKTNEENDKKIEQLSIAVNNNTQVLQRIMDKLEIK